MKKKLKARKLPIASRQTRSSKASTSSTDSPSKWIRIEKPLPLPDYVRDALHRLDEAGHVAYVVGGSVRDFLLGRQTKDHDIATSAEPDAICGLFPNSVTVGRAFGVIKVPITGLPYPLEIATFRKDLDYKDHRHPEGIAFAGPVEDAMRRDFTINALFYDAKTSRVLDSVGGMDDIKGKVVRAIGDPSERFREDALRLLRAVRFATTLGFSLDRATEAAIKARSRLISKVSAERIREELTLMLTGPDPRGAIERMSALDLLPHVLPEIERLKSVPGAYAQTLRILGVMSGVGLKGDRSPELAWAALLQDLGRLKGPADRDVARMAASAAAAVTTRLRMSREEVDVISHFVEEHPKFREVFQMREATLQRFVRQPRFGELLQLHRAIAIATDGNLAFYEFATNRYEEHLKSPASDAGRLLTGEDLIQLGLSPGPRFSEILRTVEDLAMEHKLKSKEEALEYVVQHYVR